MKKDEIIIEKNFYDIVIDTEERKLSYRRKGFSCNIGDVINIHYDDLLWSENISCICPLCGERHILKKDYIKRNKNTRCSQCKGKKNNEVFCQFCGERSSRTYNGKGICNRHRFQIRRYGHIIQGRYEPNTYVDKGDYYEIELWSKGEKLEKCGYIDKEDYDKVKDIRWHLDPADSSLEYLANCNNGTTTRMHNVILGKDYIVDHIDGNGLNNRRSNLRYVTNSQNGMNTKHRLNTTSGVKGVAYRKGCVNNKWLAHIKTNNKQIEKSFCDLEEAVKFRKEMELKYFGEYLRPHDWKDEYIYINGIKEFSDYDGEDFRTVIFISGCWWNCNNCHNPTTHNVTDGQKIKIAELIKIINNIDNENITISGGDGLTYQIRETYELIKELKLYYNKNIWVYTGYTYEGLLKDKNPIRQEILKYIDVLVDGKFNYVRAKENPNPLYRGSDDQRIIDVKQSLQQDKLVLYDC